MERAGDHRRARVAAYDDPVELIGNTPLVYLPGPSERAGADIWGKCEFLNPSGSVKDRAARQIVVEAEARGELGPGGTIVEGTAGNTGIGLALVAAVRGYRCILVIPDTMSPEKIALARLMGAEVQLVPKTGYDDPEHYVHRARALAAEMDNAICADQFDNVDNVKAHYVATGPELWEQTGGQIDALVCGAGTGGTISGAGRFLKERDEGVDIVLSDPGGSALFSYVKHGRLEAEGSSVIEGVGISRKTECFDDTVVDEALQIGDQAALDETYRLLWEAGLHCGASAGLSVAGAIRWGRERGGGTIVCVLCDLGSRYSSTIFDPEWLVSQDLEPPRRPE